MSSPSYRRKATPRSVAVVRRFRALPEAVRPVTVDVVPESATAVVPALLGDGERGTDQLRILARTAWDRPCVYVAMLPPEADAPEGVPPAVLYVGSTTRDLSQRWQEHLDSVAGGVSSASQITRGANRLRAAVWLAVPVEAVWRRTLEDALTVLLAPVLQPATRTKGVRLSLLHVSALEAAGWTRDAADEWVRAALVAHDGEGR